MSRQMLRKILELGKGNLDKDPEIALKDLKQIIYQTKATEEVIKEELIRIVREIKSLIEAYLREFAELRKKLEKMHGKKK